MNTWHIVIGLMLLAGVALGMALHQNWPWIFALLFR